MAVAFAILEQRQYLEMRSSRSRNWLRAAINASAFSIVFYMTFHLRLTRAFLYPLAILGASLSAFTELQVQTARVRISKFEAQVIGNFRSSRSTNRHVPLAKIQGLEFRKEVNGGHLGGYQPGGLYARLEYGGSCLLPNISEEQTALAIEAIYRRYPELPFGATESHSMLFRNDAVSLGLDRTERTIGRSANL